jgi:hypothetical protein
LDVNVLVDAHFLVILSFFIIYQVMEQRRLPQAQRRQRNNRQREGEDDEYNGVD